MFKEILIVLGIIYTISAIPVSVLIIALIKKSK